MGLLRLAESRACCGGFSRSRKLRVTGLPLRPRAPGRESRPSSSSTRAMWSARKRCAAAELGARERTSTRPLTRSGWLAKLVEPARRLPDGKVVRNNSIAPTGTARSCEESRKHLATQWLREIPHMRGLRAALLIALILDTASLPHQTPALGV